MLPLANLVSCASASCQSLHGAPFTNLSSLPSFSHLLMGGKQPGCLWRAERKMLKELCCCSAEREAIEGDPCMVTSIPFPFGWLCSWFGLKTTVFLPCPRGLFFFKKKPPVPHESSPGSAQLARNAQSKSLLVMKLPETSEWQNILGWKGSLKVLHRHGTCRKGIWCPPHRPWQHSKEPNQVTSRSAELPEVWGSLVTRGINST